MSGHQRRHSQRHHGSHLQTPPAGQTLLWKPGRNGGQTPPVVMATDVRKHVGMTVNMNYELLGQK